MGSHLGPPVISTMHLPGRLQSRSAKRRSGESAWCAPTIPEVPPPNHQTKIARVRSKICTQSFTVDQQGSSEFLATAIPISSEISPKTSPEHSVPLNPSRVRSRSSALNKGRAGLPSLCRIKLGSSTRRTAVISKSDQPLSFEAAFLRESISLVIMIGRKTSFPTAGRSWRVG